MVLATTHSDTTNYGSNCNDIGGLNTHNQHTETVDSVDYNFYSFIIQGKVSLSPAGTGTGVVKDDWQQQQPSLPHQQMHQQVTNIVQSSLSTTEVRDINQSRLMEEYSRVVMTPLKDRIHDNLDPDRVNTTASAIQSAVSRNKYNDDHMYLFSSCWGQDGSNSSKSSSSDISILTPSPGNGEGNGDKHDDNVAATYSFVQATTTSVTSSPSLPSSPRPSPSSSSSSVTMNAFTNSFCGSGTRLSLEAPLFKTMGMILGSAEEEESKISENPRSDKDVNMTKDKLIREILFFKLVALFSVLLLLISGVGYGVYHHKQSMLSTNDVPTTMPTRKLPFIDQMKQMFNVNSNVDNVNSNKNKAEEESKKKAEEDKKKKQQEEETKRKVEEERKKKLEEESKRRLEEENRKRIEEDKRRKLEEDKRRVDEENRKKMGEEKKKAEEERKRLEGEKTKEKDYFAKKASHTSTLSSSPSSLSSRESISKHQGQQEQRLKKHKQASPPSSSTPSAFSSASPLASSTKNSSPSPLSSSAKQKQRLDGSKQELDDQKDDQTKRVKNHRFTFASKGDAGGRNSQILRSIDTLQVPVVLSRVSKYLLNATVSGASKFFQFLKDRGVIEDARKKFIMFFNYIRVKASQGIVYLKPIVKRKAIDAGKFSLKLSKKLIARIVDALPVLLSMVLQRSSQLVDHMRRELHEHAERQRKDREERLNKLQ